MRKLIYILLVIMMVRTTTYIDCGGGPPPPPPTQGGGFNTQFLIFDGRIIDYYAYAKGIGKWKREDASDIPQGSIFELPNALMPNGWSADGVGQVYIAGGRAPAYWTFTTALGACAGKTTLEQKMFIYPVVKQLCITYYLSNPFSITPSTIYTANPPAPVVVTGTGISSLYGMPLLRYYDQTGALRSQASATWVAPDGTSLSGPQPDVTTVPSGNYTGIISNVNIDASHTVIGTVRVEVVEPKPPPEPRCCTPGHPCIC